MVSSTLQAPWLLLTRVSDASKTLCLSFCQHKIIQSVHDTLQHKEIASETSSGAGNPPSASLVQAGSLSPGQRNDAHKEGSRAQAGDTWDMPAAVGGSEDPETLRKLTDAFVASAKDRQQHISYLPEAALCWAQQSCWRHETRSWLRPCSSPDSVPAGMDLCCVHERAKKGCR